MIFEKMKTIPKSQELIDKSFKKAKRAFDGKKNSTQLKKDSYESMIITASNIISDNLINVVRAFPNFENIDLFYRELLKIIVDIDYLKLSLSKITWASKKSHDLGREYIQKLRNSHNSIEIQKEIFGRLSSILKSVDSELLYLIDVRNILKKLPDINPDMNTIIVAGYPNVGKSSFVSSITNAKIKIESYPFTTKSISVGHYSYNNLTYQVIDTPGLLDRPMKNRNKIELQSITALKYLKAVILIIIDPSETCGYSTDKQLNLVKEIKNHFFNSKIITISNKLDLLSQNITLNIKNYVDAYISTFTGDGISELIEVFDRYFNG